MFHLAYFYMSQLVKYSLFLVPKWHYPEIAWLSYVIDIFVDIMTLVSWVGFLSAYFFSHFK